MNIFKQSVKKSKFISISILFLISCADGDRKTNKSTSKENDTSVPVQKHQIAKSNIEVVKKFLEWYKSNQNKLYSFNCIKGGILSNDSIPSYYYVDFKEVNKEIKFLKNSNLFSIEFLKEYENYYVEGENNFKQNPQNDGPPANFDYDYFFRTQDDYETDLKNIEQIKFKCESEKSNLSYVIFSLPTCRMNYKYKLIKENEEWKIDKIDTEF